MTREPLTPSQKKFIRRGRMVSLIAAAIFIASVFALKPLIDRPARADDLLALIVGFLMLQMAVVMAVTFVIAPRNPAAPRRQLTYVLTAATAGVTMLLPIVGQGFIDPRLNFAIILVLTAASFWFTWRIWRASDELSRAVMTETNSANYWILCTALVVYAVGERLGILSGVTAWGALAFATLASIPVGIWIAMRRGMTQTPKD
jgi:hypothetical protein